MIARSLIVLVAACQWGHAEEFALDLQQAAAGPVNRELMFVVEGEFVVTERAGIKLLELQPEPIVDATGQVGPAAKGAARIEARFLAERRARSYPRFGVGVHGISGYRLMINPPLKRVELIKGDEVVAHTPFTWESGEWTELKLEVKRDNEQAAWQVLGQARQEGQAVVEIQAEADSTMSVSGRCAVWGTPYAGLPIWIDAVRGAVETGS